MCDVTEDALLDYFYCSGGDAGKVRNADLLKTYKPYIAHNDLQLRAKYREEFKLIMDRIAVVKSENGEKFLVLRKKYRQMLLERGSRPQETQERTSSPARTSATVSWEAPSPPSPAAPPAQTPAPRDPAAALPAGDEDGGGSEGGGAPPGGPQSTEPNECAEPPSSQEYESEHDDDSLENMGSTSVALDPIEKDWLYSAACARVPDLSSLLQQDPSLANKKDFTSTALHWAAKHGKEDMATLVVNAGADVNTKSHVSLRQSFAVCFVSAAFKTGSDLGYGYTPLHIAALHGHRHILDLLVQTYGAKNNLRDYSGHLASQYLNVRDPEEPEEESETPFQATQARERSRNRRLHSLFLSKKRWGSVGELGSIEEERPAPPQQLPPPPPPAPASRPRKFSR